MNVPEREMLGASPLTYLVDHSKLFSSWFETNGVMDLIVYILSALQLPLNVFMVIVLCIYPKKSNHYNSFFFITNLAITDIVGSIVTICSVIIQQKVWSHQRDFSSFDAASFEGEMKSGCRIQMGLTTMVLTLDAEAFL